MLITRDEIRARIDAFAAELTALVQKAALESVVSALGGAAPKAAAAKAPVAKPAPAASRGPASAPKKAAPAAKPAAKAPAAKPGLPLKPPTRAARPPGAKRPPEELAATTAKLGAYIAKNPGLGIEAIGKALAIPTKDLALPVKKLLSSGKIKVTGEKRATRYFPKG
jgi:predicted component of type VI protein secretion system